MAAATPVYQLPYPQPPDPADVPADVQRLADRIEAVIAPGSASGQVPVWDNTARAWVAQAKAPNADTLDGLDSSAFLPVGGKAADADRLDGLDSTAFLGASAKAADSDRLDGLDSSAFLGGAGLNANPPASPVDGQVWVMSPGANVVWVFRYQASIGDAYRWVFAGGGWLASEQGGEYATASASYVATDCTYTIPRAGIYDLHFGGALRADGGWQALLSPQYGPGTPLDADWVSHGYYATGTEAWPDSCARFLPGRTCGAGTFALHIRASGGTARASNRFVAMLPRRVS
jgi:hypothetical protein